MDNTKKLVLEMLMENTGVALMDSGGTSDRNWQKNRHKDLTAEPEVSLEYKAPCKSDDIEITVNLYHYLPTILELDSVCDEYNALECDNWESEVYGVSDSQYDWLLNKGFAVGSSWNTYNGESILSQTMQGTELKNNGLGEGDYVLLQIHGGADVRGGYTNAKLFKYQKFQEFIDTVPNVLASIKRGDTTIALDMAEGGNGFVREIETGEVCDILEGDTITASL